MLLFSPIEIVIKMLSKKNDVISHRFLTTLHLEVSGRPSAFHLVQLCISLIHRQKREKSFFWSSSHEDWGNRFRSIRIVRCSPRKIGEILQIFITNDPPDAHSNLSASSVNSSQIPFIKILPWLTLRKPKTNKWGEGTESNSDMWFSILFQCLNFCGAVLLVTLTSVPDHVWTGQGPYRQVFQVYPVLKRKKIQLWMDMPLALRIRGQALALSAFLL